MNWKKAIKTTTEDQFSIINKGCEIQGTLTIGGNLVIKGTFEGTIRGDTVQAESGSLIKASLKLKTLSLAGTFEGEIEVEDTLTLLKTAQVKGRILCGRLIVEAGARLNGEIEVATPDDDSDFPHSTGREREK